MRSGLYIGPVTHVRTRPRRHAMRYRVFKTLLDLDELGTIKLRLFSRGRFNLISFHDKDHGDGSGALRPYVETLLADGGVPFDGGPIRLLCMPRVMGYVFNPISTYYCSRKSGELAAILYEVTSTFGVRHTYLFAVDGADAVHRHGCDKNLYVSPFMDMDMRYDFQVTEPGARCGTVITGSDPDGLLITAAFSGERRELTDRSLLAAFLGHPLLTLKVVAGIHWEAAKLLAKGVKLTRQPAPPERPVTVTLSSCLLGEGQGPGPKADQAEVLALGARRIAAAE